MHCLSPRKQGPKKRLLVSYRPLARRFHLELFSLLRHVAGEGVS